MWRAGFLLDLVPDLNLGLLLLPLYTFFLVALTPTLSLQERQILPGREFEYGPGEETISGPAKR